jgi:DNA-binding LacI/PurR family transcriptional regulator
MSQKRTAASIPKLSRVQMTDIARLAGVSSSTVSRALNGSSLVNDQTSAKVLAIAKSMNYSIDVGAQNLRRKQNRTIAVVLPFDFRTAQMASDPFFIGLLGGIADALTSRGYEMLLSRVDAELLYTASQLVLSGRAAALIVIGQWHQHDQLNQIAKQGIPLVVWGAKLADQQYCTVGSDNFTGGYLAAEHLIKRGCKNIAFLGDPVWPEVSQRFEGYRAALKKHKISFNAELQIPAAFIADSGRNAIEHLMRRKVPFDGVFACSDLLAMTAIQTLAQRGVRVPSEVAVVGYDDVALASYFHPAISTIAQPMPEAGESIVSLLLDALSGLAITSKTLETSLKVRASSLG